MGRLALWTFLIVAAAIIGYLSFEDGPFSKADASQTQKARKLDAAPPQELMHELETQHPDGARQRDSGTQASPRFDEKAREAQSSEDVGNQSLMMYSSIAHGRSTEAPCWGLGETAPGAFSVKADRAVRTEGESSVSLASNVDGPNWGMIFQRADARELAGRLVEFSADIRAFGVDRGANLFVRVDDATGTALAIETTMENGFTKAGADEHLAIHRITGDLEWSTHHIILRIPDDAVAISYGVALQGDGKVWIDNGFLGLAAEHAQNTGFRRQEPLLKTAGVVAAGRVVDKPENLGFERDGFEEQCQK